MPNSVSLAALLSTIIAHLLIQHCSLYEQLPVCKKVIKYITMTTNLKGGVKMEGLPEKLYHYCGLPSFLSILSTKSIWLTDIEKSNDSMERKWILNFIKDFYVRTTAEMSFDIPDENQRALLEQVRAQRESELVRFDIPYSNKLIENSDIIRYVSCFSENGDMLSQWRAYADDGNGASIGFSSSLFNAINEFSSNQDFTELLAFGKVIYDIADQERFASDAIQEALSNLEGIDKNRNVLVDVILNTNIKSIFFKNPAFQEEKEWRLVFQHPRVTEYFTDYCLHSGDQFHFLPLDFFSKRNDIISLYPLSFGPHKKPIKEIIIGPKSKLSVDDVRLLLYSKKYLNSLEDSSISIKKSTASYR